MLNDHALLFDSGRLRPRVHQMNWIPEFHSPNGGHFFCRHKSCFSGRRAAYIRGRLLAVEETITTSRLDLEESTLVLVLLNIQDEGLAFQEHGQNVSPQISRCLPLPPPPSQLCSLLFVSICFLTLMPFSLPSRLLSPSQSNPSQLNHIMNAVTSWHMVLLNGIDWEQG